MNMSIQNSDIFMNIDTKSYCIFYIDNLCKRIVTKIRIILRIIEFNAALVLFKNADIVGADLCHQVGDATFARLHS